MRVEKYVEDAKSDIDFKVDYIIKELEEYANENNLEKSWVLETFLSKLQYRILQIMLERRTI